MRLDPLARVALALFAALCLAPPAAAESTAPSTIREYVVEATGDRGLLRAHVRVDRDTGTMHFAARLRFEDSEGRTFALESETARGPLAPIVDRIVPLSDGRFAVIGWSSWGSGMQTNHAVLVRLTPKGPRLESELQVTTSRADAEFLVDTKGGLRIGVVLPACAIGKQDPERGLGCPLHDEEEWGVKTEALALNIEGVRGTLVFEPLPKNFPKAPHPSRYCPPFQACAGRQPDPEKRVAWFEVKDRFVPPTRR